MPVQRKLPFVAIALGVAIQCGLAHAQPSSGFQQNSSFSRSSAIAANNYASTMNNMRAPSTFGVGANSIRSKPFSTYTSQPTVSPYLNLFRNDLNGQSDFNYSTLVQPQLQQQQVNDQQQRLALQNARRLQQIAAQPDYNPQGSKEAAPTGHQTVYKYTGHYFPVARVRQKR